MTNWDNNIYYHPEKYDLVVIAEEEDENLSYAFDQIVFWQHKDGRVFCAIDSGGSCPSPFEDYSGIAELTPVPNLIVAEQEFDAWNKKIYPENSFKCNLGRKLTLLDKVEQVLKGDKNG